MVCLPDGEIILKICLLVLTEYTDVTDRRTDRQTPHEGIPCAYAYHCAAKLMAIYLGTQCTRLPLPSQNIICYICYRRHYAYVVYCPSWVFSEKMKVKLVVVLVVCTAITGTSWTSGDVAGVRLCLCLCDSSDTTSSWQSLIHSQPLHTSWKHDPRWKGEMTADTGKWRWNDSWHRLLAAVKVSSHLTY